MKIDVSQAKRGVVLNIDGNLLKVIDVGHTHMGRGGATYTLRLKNIITGQNIPMTYKSGTTLEQADVSTKNATYLYNSANTYSFMEGDTGEIHDVSQDSISEVIPYLKESLDLHIMIYEDQVIGVILPATISYKISSTLEGDRGDRANAGRKPATLENGLEVQVPLHMNEGATVSVNTDTGQVV